MSYLRYLCLFVHSDVQHILCSDFCSVCLRLVSSITYVCLRLVSSHNLCCQIGADDNLSTCTFTTGKSVTCTGACAKEIIPNRSGFFTKRKKDPMLESILLIL
jgi:hypothetical protein